MKKSILSLSIFFILLACQKEEETPDFSFLSGVYQGGSQNIAKYCTGYGLRMVVYDKNTVLVFAQCGGGRFEGYHIEQGRSDSIKIGNNGYYYYVKINYSLVDDKTGKEVGYFQRDSDITPPNVSIWFFRSPLLVSTTKDSLYDYVGNLTVLR